MNKKASGRVMVKKAIGSRAWLVIIRAEENTAAPKSEDGRTRKDR